MARPGGLGQAPRMTEAASDTTARSVDFEGLQIAHDERVLEPRPWTAMQSRWAAELVESHDGPGARVLELCAGAGHIGLLAASLSGASLVCVDLNPVACEYAVANAAAAGLAERVEVRCTALEQARTDGEAPFDLVIADPPWVLRDEIGRFPEDPELAIDGGPDGLDVARACLVSARSAVEPGASLLLQLGDIVQAQRLADDEAAAGWQTGEVRQGERGVVLRLVAV